MSLSEEERVAVVSSVLKKRKVKVLLDKIDICSDGLSQPMLSLLLFAERFGS